MITTYERGRIEGQRQAALLLLEANFGPLTPEVKQRVEALSPEQLHQLLLDQLKAKSLKELRLEGDEERELHRAKDGGDAEGSP